MALIGHVDNISRSRIEGWIVDTDRPNETVSVSILVNGAHRGMCLTTHARTDVVLPGGEPVTGKCAFYFAFDPPLSPFVGSRIDVVETWSAEPLLNGSSILPAPMSHGGDGAGVVPILVTSTGRTGTTLLMSEFARHPDIVVGDHFPYEIKQIAYHAAAFRALAADADRERSTTPETMLAPEMNRIIGSNPYNTSGFYGLGGPRTGLRDFYQTTVPSGFAALFRNFIVEFYATLAKAQGKGHARFFCEKGDIDDAAVQGARLFFDTVKDIVIVRDPRDLLCSAMAFWKLRPEAAMAMLTTTIPQLARIARQAGSDTTVIRYEDLVRDPLPARRALSDFLGLDLLSHYVAETAAIPDSHRTSRDPAASIGRWRNDLTPDQIEACDVAFGSYMRNFDYDPGHKPASRARSGGGGRASRGPTAGSQIVAAEGALAVTAFVENFGAMPEAGLVSRQVLELSFGREGTGEAFTLDGWSRPERGFVWSCASRSRLRLPAIRRAGDYRLLITASPFTHGTGLPSQRVMVQVNGQPAGTARLRDICVLSIPLPAAVSRTGATITLTLRFPDAASPSSILGGDDDRVLGFSLHRIALFQILAEEEASNADPRETIHGPAAAETGGPDARLTEMLQRVLDQPDLRYRPRTLVRGIAGCDSINFVRLILALETEFGIELREDEVDSIVTLGDIATIVRGKMANLNI